MFLLTAKFYPSQSS